MQSIDKILQETLIGDKRQSALSVLSEPIIVIIYSKPFPIAINQLDIFYMISQVINEHTNISIQEFVPNIDQIQVQKYSFRTDQIIQGGFYCDELAKYIKSSMERKAEKKQPNNYGNFFFFRFTGQQGQIDEWREMIERIRYYRKEMKTICKNYQERDKIIDTELYADMLQKIQNCKKLQPKQLHDIIFL